MIKGLENVKILESWSWDRDELVDLLNETRRKIRLLDKERKLQPPLILQTLYGKHKTLVTRYEIIDLEKGLFCAESKEWIEEEEDK